jgi:hypothetical protein
MLLSYMHITFLSYLCRRGMVLERELAGGGQMERVDGGISLIEVHYICVHIWTYMYIFMLTTYMIT